MAQINKIGSITTMKTKKLNLQTIVLHSGYDNIEHQKTMAVPIYQTTAYFLESVEESQKLFDLNKEGAIYGRTANPTVSVLENRLSQIENGDGAIATSSGKAARPSLATRDKAGSRARR